MYRYLYAYMNISIGWVPAIELLGHETCLFKSVMLPALLLPKRLCQLAISRAPQSARVHNPWLFIQIFSMVYILPKWWARKWHLVPICISLLLEKLQHIYFHISYVCWVFIFLQWIACPRFSSIFVLHCLSFLKWMCGSICMLHRLTLSYKCHR